MVQNTASEECMNRLLSLSSRLPDWGHVLSRLERHQELEVSDEGGRDNSVCELIVPSPSLRWNAVLSSLRRSSGVCQFMFKAYSPQIFENKQIGTVNTDTNIIIQGWPFDFTVQPFSLSSWR